MPEARTIRRTAQARILVVDDEAVNLRLAEAMLHSDGHDCVVSVQDPHQVLAHYAQAPTDLIVLDLNMPHLDGYAVMEQLAGLNDPLLPPILVLTAQRSKDHLVRALAAGARDFVSKPFDRVELLLRVRNLLDAHLAHRRLYEQRNVLEQVVRERTKALHHSRLEVVQRLGRAAEYRDEETGNHILRMSHTAALLARAAGWTEQACELLLHAAPMHDIGKIGIPDRILLKPGKLDADEWQIMKTHAEIGAQLLDGGDSELLHLAREVALTHHERWDGSGYPQGLAGEAIPQSGRVCALADVFDALTSARPYKKPWKVEAAIELIQAESGRHFEPRLVSIFVQQVPAILEIHSRFSDPAERVQVPRVPSELENLNAELTRMSARLISAQEEERRRISRELHDQVGQVLTALKIQLGALAAGDASMTPVLAPVRELADEALRQARDLTASLHPHLLEDLGLAPALRALIERFVRPSGLEVELYCELKPPRGPKEAELVAFRIVQESLTNVVRHANARTAWVRLNTAGGCLKVEVQDDGEGSSGYSTWFDSDGKASLGVAGMRDRAHELGGEFHMESTAGDGTTVRAQLPW